MKNLILIIASVACFSLSAQKNCKFAINEIDKISGKAVKQTNLAHIVKKFNVKVGMCMQHYGDEFYFILAFNYGSATGQVGQIDIKKDQELTLLLDNGEKMILKCYEDRNGVVSNHSCAINFVTYQITPEQIKKLIEHPITNFRYDRWMNGAVSFDTFELEKKDQEELQEVLKCIL
jgi:hypothetical protein